MDFEILITSSNTEHTPSVLSSSESSIAFYYGNDILVSKSLRERSGINNLLKYLWKKINLQNDSRMIYPVVEYDEHEDN